MARKTKEEALATRASILDAAERVFHEQGVSRTSLADIAQAAGVTRGAVYWHFKDKADVFTTMMDRVCLPIEEGSAASLQRPAPGQALASVRTRVHEVFELVVHDERARRVFEIATQRVEYVDELRAVRERHLQVRNGHTQQLVALFRDAQAHGEIPATLQPATAALGLHALIDGLLHNWLLDPTVFELTTTGMDAVDHYLAGVASRPPR